MGGKGSGGKRNGVGRKKLPQMIKRTFILTQTTEEKLLEIGLIRYKSSNKSHILRCLIGEVHGMVKKN